MFFHREQRQLFLRIAYAGAPLSGKTETLKALLPLLHTRADGNALFSPFAARGRTLYFDWMQYQGGVFMDGPLQCQITSVPGQESLHRRRRVLIEDADAVVFVIDSQPDQIEINRRCLAEIQPWLQRGDLPPVNVIYQANKRDLAGTLDIAEIRQALSLDPDAEIYETSALQGEGIRICFVAGVRACIRRAEALRDSNRLPEGAPDIASGEQLLERVREADTPAAAHQAEAAAPASPAPQPAGAGEPAPALAAATAPATATAPAATAMAPAAARPAVMPMADWSARQQSAAADPRADPQEPPNPAATPFDLAPGAGTAAAAPAPAAATLPRVGGRAAVMPMADWLATYTSRAAAREAQAAAAAPQRLARDSPHNTQAAMPIVTLPAAAGHLHLRAVPPPAALPQPPAVAAGAAPLSAAVAAGGPDPPPPAAPRSVHPPPAPAAGHFAGTAGTIGAAGAAGTASALASTAATGAAGFSPVSTAASTPAAAGTVTSAAIPGGSGRTANVAAPESPNAPPAPWLPGHESSLLDAWPLAIWRLALQAADRQPQAPAVVAGSTLQGRVGGGWHARAWGILPGPEAGKAELKRLTSWLMRLGNSVSSRRCLVLAGSAQGCCVWQVVHQELTFDQLIDQTLEEQLPAKEAVQIMAGTAVDFVNASQEFALQGVELPIRFHTLARENGFTVYSAFLPREPVQPVSGDALAELAGELRFFLQAERLNQLDVGEALRELERLSEARPRNSPAIEVLQSLLIGE